MKSFTELDAWKVGLDLVREIHILTGTFPSEERYELVKQIRRSSKSVLANLAEGFGRFTYPDKAAKYTIARGECSETQAFLFISIALNYLTQQDAQKAIELSDRTGRLISGLILSTKSRT